jgi:hypothetical protein
VLQQQFLAENEGAPLIRRVSSVWITEIAREAELFSIWEFGIADIAAFDFLKIEETVGIAVGGESSLRYSVGITVRVDLMKYGSRSYSTFGLKEMKTQIQGSQTEGLRLLNVACSAWSISR